MTADEYRQFSLHGRAELLWEKGQYLETIPYYGYQVRLYLLYSFFVEVYVKEEIESIEPLEDLSRYVNRIRIDTF
jgi:hypothetical protein